jgi:aspartate/methionine/tyrosine aminotransferase
MSKTFNMAGWRIGAAFGNAEHLKNMLRFKSNMANGMYLPMQFAAAKALALDAQWYEMIRATYRKRRAIVNTIAEKLNCSVGAGQQGIFVWAKIPDNAKDAFTFSDNILKEKNIFITPGGIFGDEGKRFVRLTLCANENVLTKVLERLDKKWK